MMPAGATPYAAAELAAGPSATREPAKSSVIGASANFINSIVGAGIIGLAFALYHTGFFLGVRGPARPRVRVAQRASSRTIHAVHTRAPL